VITLFSVRLPEDLEKRINALSKKNNVNKSDIVREALQEYLGKEELKEMPYELGEDLFGCYGSGDGTQSVNYKQKLKEKLRAKNTD
jgi:predicted DNA-binding protein